ncbi:MAG: hypothetical protein UGF89_06495 [Acutalibacteraceae bacterium]|nr:hypothetical protein [Acutalibacteraceae bacterium]
MEKKITVRSAIGITVIGMLVLLVVVFLALMATDKKLEAANTEVVSTFVVSAEAASEAPEEGLVPVITGSTVYGKYRYFRDVVTDTMYMYIVDKPLVQMEDPATGLPLTYEKYLEYKEDVAK